jgi:FMN reductase
LRNEPSDFHPFIVGIGGTARAGSTSERAVFETLKAAEQCGARTHLFNGDFISKLPLYIPGQHARNENELLLVETIRKCHGLIVGTPGYHGSISGPIKNALDLLEDTASDPSPYLSDRSFGCIVTAFGWQACGSTLVSLRIIAHALRAWPTPFGATLNTSTPIFGEDGGYVDALTGTQLKLVATQVVHFAQFREAARRSERVQIAR